MKFYIPFLCIAFTLSPSLYAMHSTPKEATVGINDRFLYVGEGKIKKALEEIYGEKFPLNAVWVSIWFSDLRKRNKKPYPALVPYDWIKNKKEGDTLTLPLHNIKNSFACRQLKAPENTIPFEKYVQNYYEKFLTGADAS